MKHGLGVSVVPKYLVMKELAEGELVLVSELEHQIEGAYYLVYNSDRENEYAIKIFRDWLVDYKEPKERFKVRSISLL